MAQDRRYEVTLRWVEEDGSVSPEFVVTIITWSEDLAVEQAMINTQDPIEALFGDRELELRGVKEIS